MALCVLTALRSHRGNKSSERCQGEDSSEMFLGEKSLVQVATAMKSALESPLDCKEISPRISLEGMMLKLKLQYLGHLM